MMALDSSNDAIPLTLTFHERDDDDAAFDNCPDYNDSGSGMRRMDRAV